MKEYSIDVKIYGTLYIKAANEDEALARAMETDGESLYFRDTNLGNGVTLSSAMTIHGPDEGDAPEEV